MILTVPDPGYERYVDPAAYLKSATVVMDGDRLKTVIRTAERADLMTLTDKSGYTYGEVSNICEPFDFKTHVFYVPRTFLAGELTVRFFCRVKNTPSAFFEKVGDRGVTVLTPDRIQEVTREELIESYDNHITPNSRKGKEIAPGIRYEILECVNKKGAPVRMFAIHADAGKAKFHAGTAHNGYAPHTEIQTVKGQAEASIEAGHPVVATVNADFFDMFGNCAPSGLCVKDGRSIANAQSLNNFFGMTRNGVPVIGNFRENPELYCQLQTAVSGREIFLRDGEIADFSPAEPFASIPHPRTAVGIGKNGDVTVLVVDGRLPQLSNGASLIDLARVMQSFHMDTAINLDGGGSSTFIVKEEGTLTMLNRPADLEQPDEPLIRDIYNSLQVVAVEELPET